MQESRGAQHPDWQVLAAGDEQGDGVGQFLRHRLEEARSGAQAGNQHFVLQDQSAESAAAHRHVPGKTRLPVLQLVSPESELWLLGLSTART